MTYRQIVTDFLLRGGVPAQWTDATIDLHLAEIHTVRNTPNFSFDNEAPDVIETKEKIILGLASQEATRVCKVLNIPFEQPFDPWKLTVGEVRGL